MIVNLYEISQPFSETLSAHLTEIRHDDLYEAVSIFLLVRQQLQRINRIPALALGHCMRSEDLGLVNTFACVHHQEPVGLLPVASLSTNRAPPILCCTEDDLLFQMDFSLDLHVHGVLAPPLNREEPTIFHCLSGILSFCCIVSLNQAS